MFTRKTVTLPAVGEFVEMSVGGCGVVVESAPTYSGVLQVPGFRYDDRTAGLQPIYPQSKYSPGAAGFDRLIFESTQESAGDSITILVSSVPIQPEINLNVAGSSRATLKPTFVQTLADAVFKLSELQIIDDGDRYPTAMYITARGSDAVYSFGGDPVQGGGVGHVLKEKEVQKIEGINFITQFSIINAVSAGSCDLSITFEY